MTPFPLQAARGRPTEILCIGAHCDDIEIGCGGTLLALRDAGAPVRMHWLVLTSNPQRRAEAQQAFEAFVAPGARGVVHIHDLPDGRLPAHFQAVRDAFDACRKAVTPDLVLSHHGLDRHQDHALVSQVTWQMFRDHAIWEYEIPKWDGDLATPNAYVPLPGGAAERKADAIVQAFASQRDKSWFSADNLLALMRLRGLECRAASGFAEGFHCRKLVFDAAGVGA